MFGIVLGISLGIILVFSFGVLLSNCFCDLHVNG